MRHIDAGQHVIFNDANDLDHRAVTLTASDASGFVDLVCRESDGHAIVHRAVPSYEQMLGPDRRRTPGAYWRP